MPMLMFFWRLLSDLTKSFLRHGCGSLAASLAFFSLLSLFPFGFMVLYGVSFIVSHEVIGGQVLAGGDGIDRPGQNLVRQCVPLRHRPESLRMPLRLKALPR